MLVIVIEGLGRLGIGKIGLVMVILIFFELGIWEIELGFGVWVFGVGWGGWGDLNFLQDFFRRKNSGLGFLGD